MQEINASSHFWSPSTSGVYIVLKKGRARSCFWSSCCPSQGGRKWRETRPIPRRLRIRSVVCDSRLIVSLTIVILSTSTLTCTFSRQKGSHCRGVVRALGDYYFQLQSAARFIRNFRPLLPQLSKHKSSPPSSYHKKQFNTRMPTMNMTKCSSGNAHAAEVKAMLFNAALERCAVWWKQLHMRD